MTIDEIKAKLDGDTWAAVQNYIDQQINASTDDAKAKYAALLAKSQDLIARATAIQSSGVPDDQKAAALGAIVIEAQKPEKDRMIEAAKAAVAEAQAKLDALAPSQ